MFGANKKIVSVRIKEKLKDAAAPPEREKPEPKKKRKSYSWSRILFQSGATVTILLLSRYLMTESTTTTFASVLEKVERRVKSIQCSNDYKEELLKFQGCTPTQCGRVVADSVVSLEEAAKMLEIAKKGLSHGGGSGGASILDLHSGALSMGDKFVNIYQQIAKEEGIFTEEDFKLYKTVKNKIHRTICEVFGIDPKKLHLTNPTFFSRMTAKPARTIHDEYWHDHVDKETYGSFDYTSLLYLTDYIKDFTGGRFVFKDAETNTTVEPKLGRLSFFTSGSENVHFVEKVSSGTRYAVTVSFTCDELKAIQDPDLRTTVQTSE